MYFDCVIPYGPNDKNIINVCINYASKNLIGLRNIYVISYDKDFSHNLSKTIDENLFPFNKKDIEKIVNPNRSGWYLQQLLKMYAHKVIDNLSEYFLIIDSDTIFLKPTEFFENEIPLYNFSFENNIPYFIHMKKLHPSLKKVSDKSGICHHIMFKQEYLNSLFKLVEDFHSQSFWEVFIDKIEGINSHAVASEYEIYFNYIHIYYPNNFKLRYLKYKDVETIDFQNKNNNFYVSNHHYIRK